MEYKKNKVEEIKKNIKRNKSYSCSLPEICEKNNLNYHTFRKWFKEIEGISLNEFCQKCKLNYSIERLKYSNEKISSIASEVGFRNESDFIRWFKSKTFKTPIFFKQNQNCI